ncbi:hypothetical protein Pfo_025015 [Paulownia fortunei]|nr:hypothetical protein Pfo_025015 [Paulownia fortunei]
MPPVEVDHPTPRSEKTGLKLTFKNLGKNPIVTCTLKCVVSKKISFKNPNVEAPETSTANESSKDLGRNPQYTCKRRRDCQEEESTMKKKPKNVNLSRNLPQPPPALPQAFKSHILLMGGCLDDVILVIQKELYDTDVNKSQNRLSMPFSKVNIQFLTSKEVDHLDAPKAEIQATLIEPCLQECEISLRNWKSNSMFALVSPWKEVCRRNQLREGKVIQLWSFRRNSKLCFALVPIN